ncbi:autotransporter domain outer membrane protein, putative [Syntrophotalea carbinolica DSM 2380]|uniref:Autotransporter domain outer membrane protein, putative n=1 Tax=Syntrophotalea carbinolica (strain DSM 2380 / NBRC 103641 / GraBd1) TaxID=338963 RepID=Q3A0R9_SYNC1|nr:autotransporter outer membrane beta-barrel domain-containing protein [Syntrophotalea carbinolica]ABA90038.1 autotransporter domain outer membrane protein, putative [Syntrophotalea carbinolica DSM 2380]
MRFNGCCFRGFWGLVAMLAFLSVFNATQAGAQTVAYYNLSNPANTNAEMPILAAGHTPVQLGGLSAADLAGYDVVWILNPSNGGYATELTNNLDAISGYVQSGGVLMFHDRYVTDAAAVIPGAGDVAFFRDFTDGASIELGPGATGSLLSGPGGIIDADSLDGGGYSSHGYALASSLPAGSVIVLTRTDATEVVDFYYSLGGGNVYYSTIPLDHYLSGSNNFTNYAANLAAFIFEIVGPAGSPVQFQHIAMADTLRNDIDMVSGSLDEGETGLFVSFDSKSIERGNSDEGRSFRSWDNAVMVGYTHEVATGTLCGAAFSYHDAGNRSKYDSGLKGEYESFGITAFGRIALPALAGHELWLDLVANYSFLEDVELERNGNVGESDGYQYGVNARIGTVLPLTDRIGLYPKIGVEHIQTRVDSYKEKGVGALRYSVLEANSTYGIFSLEGKVDLFHDEVWGLGSALLVEYRKRFGQSTDNVKTTLVDVATASMPMDLYDYDSDLGKIELKFDVDYRAVSLEMSGGYYFGNSDYEGLGGSLSLRVPL